MHGASMDIVSSHHLEHTLDLLYSAQRQSHQSPSPDLEEPSQTAASTAVASKGMQQSLHRFWNIQSAPAAVPSDAVMVEQPTTAASSCDDCGASIGPAQDDGGMDVDGYGNEADNVCGACGKHVCFSCSVSNLGAQKRCLRCAGTKLSQRSVGWPNAGVSVF
jgi:hypothetical protein